MGLSHLLVAISLVSRVVSATPTVAFPINSQVPPVARVGDPYSFTFSQSTFATSGSWAAYFLFGAPAWLQLDSDSRTFSGTPGIGDVGAPEFEVQVSDDTGSVNMSVTFIVSNSPAPVVINPVSDQLAAFGEVSGPTSLEFYPSTSFSFSFSKDGFVNGSNLNYYSVSDDNTPLPSWINFDGGQLKFSGTTPQLSSLIAPPQAFGVQLIASDVLGFGGTTQYFDIVVGTHELIFKQEEETLNLTTGVPVNYTALSGQLLLDNSAAPSSDIQSVTANFPSWLNFDNQTFAISGTPPDSTTTQNVTITATDIYDDVANMTLLLKLTSSLLTVNSLPTLNATIGEPFNYTLDRSLFSNPDVNVQADLNNASSWLSFDPSTLAFNGTVPSDIQPSDTEGNLTVSLNSTSMSQSFPFTIHVETAAAKASASAAGSSVSSQPTSTGTLSSTSQTAAPVATSQSGPSKGAIAAAVVVPICSLMVVLLALFCCCRRRRREQDDRPISPSKRNISRPIVRDEDDDPWPVAEKIESPEMGMGTPHRLPLVNALSGVWKSSTNLRNSRYFQKRGPMDEEGGFESEQGSARARTPQNTPQSPDPALIRNFSLKSPVPARPARPFPDPDISPTRRYSARRSSRYSVTSTGLPISRRVSGVGHGSGGFGPPGHGVAKRSWRNSSYRRRTWGTIDSDELSALTESTDVLDVGAETPSIRIVKDADAPRQSFRQSFRSARNDYFKSRVPSPFFAGGSTASSLRSKSRYLDRQAALRTSSIPPTPNTSNHILEGMLRDLSSEGTLGSYSPSSSNEESHGGMQNSRRSLGSRISDSFARISRHFSRGSFLSSTYKYGSADTSPNSQQFRDDGSYIDIIDENGQRQWYRKEWPSPSTSSPRGSPRIGRDSHGNIIEYGDEQPQVETAGTVGVAYTSSWPQKPPVMGTTPLGLKLVQNKGKRPISVESRAVGRDSASQRGIKAYI